MIPVLLMEGQPLNFWIAHAMNTSLSHFSHSCPIPSMGISEFFTRTSVRKRKNLMSGQQFYISLCVCSVFVLDPPWKYTHHFESTSFWPILSETENLKDQKVTYVECGHGKRLPNMVVKSTIYKARSPEFESILTVDKSLNQPGF